MRTDLKVELDSGFDLKADKSQSTNESFCVTKTNLELRLAVVRTPDYNPVRGCGLIQITGSPCWSCCPLVGVCSVSVLLDLFSSYHHRHK